MYKHISIGAGSFHTRTIVYTVYTGSFRHALLFLGKALHAGI